MTGGNSGVPAAAWHEQRMRLSLKHGTKASPSNASCSIRRSPADRGGEPVELNGRYFDALALLVGEAGKLVSKDRFLDEVWRGVPVTDEALTQCIKTLRRQLGDDAAQPALHRDRAKHGYRFIAPVEVGRSASAAAERRDRAHRLAAVRCCSARAGTLGGGVAGSSAGWSMASSARRSRSQPGMGAISVLARAPMPDGARRR